MRFLHFVIGNLIHLYGVEGRSFNKLFIIHLSSESRNREKMPTWRTQEFRRLLDFYNVRGEYFS